MNCLICAFFLLAANLAFTQTELSHQASGAATTNAPLGAEILERAIAAGGGREASRALTGFQAWGEFSLYSHGEVMQSGTATILGKGSRQFKLTANLPTETRGWILNNGSGVLLAKNVREPIGAHNHLALQAITLPVEKIIGFRDRSSVGSVQSGNFHGKQVYRVVLHNGASPTDVNVVIDAQSFTILAIEDTIFPNRHTRDSYPHRILYADYRQVAGVSIPFSIKEEISGQLTWGLQLNGCEPNDALTDADFQ